MFDFSFNLSPGWPVSTGYDQMSLGLDRIYILSSDKALCPDAFPA